MDEPRFKHDCEWCTFLGRTGEEDVYACMQGIGYPTIVLRTSDRPEEYESSWTMVDRLPSELQDRARAWLGEQAGGTDAR